MAGKKVAFGGKPQAKATTPAAKDEWVKSRSADSNTPMKRLTIDVPEALHRKIKSGCAERGVKMADEIRTLLEKHFN